MRFEQLIDFCACAVQEKRRPEQLGEIASSRTRDKYSSKNIHALNFSIQQKPRFIGARNNWKIASSRTRNEYSRKNINTLIFSIKQKPRFLCVTALSHTHYVSVNFGAANVRLITLTRRSMSLTIRFYIQSKL